MSELDAAKVLLIRSVEEGDKGAFSATQLAESMKSAGDFDNYAAWFLGRAVYLFGQLSASYRSLIDVIRLLDRGHLFVLILAMFLGLASNYFGPAGKIHIIFNPLMALVAWNLLIYALLGLLAARRAIGVFTLRDRDHPEGVTAGDSMPGNSSAGPGKIQGTEKHHRDHFCESPPLVLRLVSPLGKGWLRLRARSEDVRRTLGKASFFSHVAIRFWTYWLEVSRKVLALRFEHLLHLGAIALTTGAILGMYFRGLFLDYNVVWRSTFIRSEGVIGLLIKLILGPAAWLLGVNLSDHANVASLMSPAGSPAAMCIHLYAVTAVILVLVPRSLFFFSTFIRIRKQAANTVLAGNRHNIAK